MGSGGPLPKAILPSCWNDDVRMNMLFSPFRSQAVNPSGWQDKMNFWVNLITDYCHHAKCITFNHEELCLTFDRHGCVPQCLAEVIAYMFSQSNLMTLTDFSRIPTQNKNWLHWGVEVFLHRPLSWGILTFTTALGWNRSDDRCVIISVVKDLASQVLQRHKSHVNSPWTDNVVYFQALEDHCKDICTGNNLQLALIQLQRENEVLLFELNGQKIVKFRSVEETIVAPVSELDSGILRLQKAKDAIQNEVDSTDNEIDRCLTDAKSFVRSGLKSKAMMSLKKKARLEKSLQKKMAALDNIECLLAQLQNAPSERMVLEAYKSGVLAMKSAVKGGLDLDKIDTTMADVEEMLDTAIEIQDTISKPVAGSDSNVSEFEDELAELLSNDKGSPVTLPKVKTPGREDHTLNFLKDLPSPPTCLPKVFDAKRSSPSKQ